MQPQARGLCAADEEPVFSCTLQGPSRKMVSLCASPIATQGERSFYYRYGKPSRIELTYPMGPNTRGALKAFQHEHHLKETGTADSTTLKAIDATLKERGVRTQAAPTTEQSNDPNRWGPPQITDSAHPGNTLFKQAQACMQAIDAKYGRTSDHQTDNAAGHMAVKAQCAGMKCIDLMELGGTSGDKIIAVQGKPGNAHSKVISVDTVAALNTPLAQSSQALAEVHAQQNQRSQQMNQPTQTQTAPALH